MRFTDGLWMHRSGLSIHNTHQMWEYRIEQDRIKAFVLCHCVEEADDYTAGTALEYTFSCPAPDMIAVDVVHFRGTTVKEPAFTLHYAKAEPQITDTAESLVMENGRMRLVIRKSKQFAYDFYFDGRHLTGSENGSTAYDTGHFTFAGEDPMAVLKKYADRVGHVHLKDMRLPVVKQARDEGWSFLQAVRNGAFTVPGDGGVQFDEVFRVLAASGYQGWLLVEAEQDPAKADPLEYAMKARTFIHEKTGL